MYIVILLNSNSFELKTTKEQPKKDAFSIDLGPRYFINHPFLVTERVTGAKVNCHYW